MEDNDGYETKQDKVRDGVITDMLEDTHYASKRMRASVIMCLAIA